MKLGDMTIRQIAEMCRGKTCYECPFYDPSAFSRCCLTCVDPAEQNLDMEVKIPMPKIKVKNIPEPSRRRICEMRRCKNCRFWMEDKGFCMLFTDYDPGDMIVELSEQDFPTNREWLEGLPDDKLVNNLVTNPIFAESGGTIEKWLSQPCESLMEEE